MIVIIIFCHNNNNNIRNSTISYKKVKILVMQITIKTFNNYISQCKKCQLHLNNIKLITNRLLSNNSYCAKYQQPTEPLRLN